MSGLRIGLVCPYSFTTAGGVQNHVLGLAGWLAANGHDPQLLAPGTLDPQRAAEHGVDVSRFTSTGRSLPVPYNGSIARIAFGPVSRLRITRWLEASDPEVLHVHEPITPSAAVLSVWATRAPVVATFHTATPGSRTMHAARRLMPATVARLDAGIAVSEVAASVVRRHIGLDPIVVGNGIRVADFRAAARTGIRRVSYLGRLNEPRKGLHVLLSALPAILEAHPDLDVVVAGDGTRPLGTPRQVRFVGPVTNSERNRLLASSDVFIAPHIGRESFGIVLLEALASGAQVVASDLPAFRAVLDDGSGPVGRLFRTGDPQSLATEVMAALRTPYDAARGLARAASFDWDQIGPLVVATYRSVSGATTRREA
ncbi:MAG TPA: glycosyltransferase family 4 protein [Propionibacteriaceae bacterium]|nr:glycosyltransferase family 4 protein [Propionibacteriaceae bacterium]